MYEENALNERVQCVVFPLFLPVFLSLGPIHDVVLIDY